MAQEPPGVHRTLAMDTGYEGNHDFPHVDGPSIVYMLAAIPRTGSSYLSHLLWRSGCLGAPLEYLNFDEGGPYFFANQSPELQRTLWESALRRRTSPNGVFGFKCFPMQLQAFHHSNPALLGEALARVRGNRVVYLGRRDRVAHVVSYARATLTGIWRAEQETGEAPSVEYSQEALEEMEAAIDLQAAIWERMFADLGIAPLRLWYEDVVADPAGAVAQVGDYLGVAIDPAAAVQVPEVLRQSTSESQLWISKYAAAKGASEG